MLKTVFPLSGTQAAVAPSETRQTVLKVSDTAGAFVSDALVCSSDVGLRELVTVKSHKILSACAFGKRPGFVSFFCPRNLQSRSTNVRWMKWRHKAQLSC